MKIVTMLNTDCDECGCSFSIPLDTEENVICNCGAFIFGDESVED